MDRPAVRYKDYYETLGVSRSATDEEVKKAFRRLAREHHPDVAKDKKGSEERFKDINEAYEVLGDPENRRKYDALGSDFRAGTDFRPPPGFGRRRSGRRGDASQAEDFDFRFGGAGFSDFFESLFGGRRAEGGFGGFGVEEDDTDEGRRGADVEGEIRVALDEVLHGSVRTVTFRRPKSRDDDSGRSSIQVRVPPGVREGQLIRVAGKGEAVVRGVPGDLYLRVRLVRHPDFQVRGADLVTDLTLAPWEAVLGATVSVPTLDGRVHVRIPAGSRNGQGLRVRGHGLPSGEGVRGDLYVTLRVDVPSQVTAEERALWERLAAVSKYAPRGGE